MMKRLTISMSDALFDKLNQVENKSLFIRKLIEGELRKGITYSSDSTYESLAGDIEDLHHEIQSLSSRLVSIENQISGAKIHPSFGKGKLESDLVDTSLIVSPMTIPAENGIGTSELPTNVPDSYAICNGLGNRLPGVVDEGQVAVFSNVSDIQVNLSTQDNDKALPVHSDEMHNIPFRSVINVGTHKEPVANVIDANGTPMTSTIVVPDMADQHQESFSVPVNNASTTSFIMPELSDAVAPAPSPFSVASPEPSVPYSPSFVMPELSDVTTPAPSPFSVASLEPSVPSSLSFVMPELSDATGHSNASPFEMPPAMSIPSSGNDLQIPSFFAAGPTAPGIQTQAPSFMMQEMQSRSPFESAAIQPQTQNNDGSGINTINMSINERLQGNILMYLPHGAQIKRSIIKGLVSKKFSAEEIDAQINLMISNRSLLVKIEDGVEYLLRS
jgi:hypothetical protein